MESKFNFRQVLCEKRIKSVNAVASKYIVELEVFVTWVVLDEGHHGKNANTIDISVSLHNIGCEHRHLRHHHEAGKLNYMN